MQEELFIEIGLNIVLISVCGAMYVACNDLKKIIKNKEIILDIKHKQNKHLKELVCKKDAQILKFKKYYRPRGKDGTSIAKGKKL